MRDVASYRMRRMNEAIKEIIGTALTHDLKDPRIGFVTLTGVETAHDLSHAKVFVSVYGKQVGEGRHPGGPACRATLPAAAHQRRAEDSDGRPTWSSCTTTASTRGCASRPFSRSSGAADLPALEDAADGASDAGEGFADKDE